METHEYFKLRKKFRLRQNKFDIGPIHNIDLIHTSGHFVMRLFKLHENEYLDFYNYHLNYFLQKNTNHKEEDFLSKVIKIIDLDIRARLRFNYDTIPKKRALKLNRFREKLKTIDKWDITLTTEERLKKSVSYVQDIMKWQNVNDTKSVLSKLLFDEVGSDKFFIEYKNIIEERDQLKIKLEIKEKEINALQTSLKRIAPSTKIQISNGNHIPIIDLFLQIKDLENPETGRPYLSGSPDTWSSLISNYFQYHENNIPNNNNRDLNWSSIRDYFLNKTGTKLKKKNNRDKYFHIKESKRQYD